MTNLTMPTAGVRDEDYKIYHASLRHNFSRCTFKNQQAGAELGGWVVIKGVQKNPSLLIFWFAHISAYVYRICKILVSTPNN